MLSVGDAFKWSGSRAASKAREKKATLASKCNSRPEALKLDQASESSGGLC